MFGVDPADDDPVVQGTKFHGGRTFSEPASWLVGLPGRTEAGPLGRAPGTLREGVPESWAITGVFARQEQILAAVAGVAAISEPLWALRAGQAYAKGADLVIVADGRHPSSLGGQSVGKAPVRHGHRPRRPARAARPAAGGSWLRQCCLGRCKDSPAGVVATVVEAATTT
jgi:hypothetical protein